MLNRREFIGRAAAGAAAVGWAGEPLAEPAAFPWKVGMYQNMLRDAEPSVFEHAKRIGLDGVELVMGRPEDNLPLRRPEVRRRYVEAARRAGLAVPSLCPNALNRVALKSEPKAAIWLLDTIEACGDFGARNILVPFFSAGELHMETDAEIQRVVDVIRDLAPRAERAGVTLGLENTLSADDNLKLLERIDAPAVKVYYDVGNSFSRGRDVPAELRKLGRARICQIHIKDNPSLLGQGKMDVPAVAAAIRDIEYRGWLVLETASPSEDVEKDTKTNLAYVKKVFAP